MIENFKTSNNSGLPKYKQLADLIVNYAISGKAKINDKLPSVQILSSELNLSRETIFKALDIVARKGIIKASNRKGYYITKITSDIDYRVFLMLDRLTSFKEKIYDAIRLNLGEKSEVDIYFHHRNKSVFKSIITQNINSYTHFVISTFFYEDVSDILNSIPNKRLILIDKFEPLVKTQHSQIYQDFSEDIFRSLYQLNESIKKYKKICLVAPSASPHKDMVVKGFEKYCNHFKVPYSLCENDGMSTIKKGDVYLLISAKNDDLVKIIKYCNSNNCTLGKEIGVISYNETQLKEVLEGGITVISTDFYRMGQRAAEIIKDGTTVIEANPSKVFFRKSL